VSDWYLEQALERYHERLDKAEHARLVQEASDAAPRPPGWREQTLIGLGDLFVAFGRRLQSSGGCTPAPTMMDATDGR